MSRIDIKKLSSICINYKIENGLTQAAMAELLSINNQIYGRIERAQHLPKLEQLEKILDVTGNDYPDILEADRNRDVFVALKGNASTSSESEVFDELIKMILCLDKHKNLREHNYGRD